MFHISDFKKYSRCPRIYFNDMKEDDKEYHPFVRSDEKTTELAIKKLHIKDYFLGAVGDPMQKSLDAMQKYEWLVKARFEYHDLRIKVPFLQHTKHGWNLYFLFIGIYPHANDMAFYDNTVWVLEQNEIEIDNIYIIHLNAEYVRGEELDPEQLYVITDHFYNNHNHPTQSIKEMIYKTMKDPSSILDEMKTVQEMDLEVPKRTNKCTGRNKCLYYEQCFPHEELMEDDSILTLIASSEKYNMKSENIMYLKDADIERIEGSRQQYAQIMADRGNGLYVDHFALHNWLSHIQYPIAFIDFEWERFAIPPYVGMKPYDVLPFEYALIVMEEDGTVKKKVYLNIHDDRRDMAENLVKDIPEIGSVIAYNADGAEKVRIQEFADMYPDLSDKLLSINERMEDLQLPFVSGIIYDIKMRGQWSLKAIMGMMDDPGYHALDIRQGMDAVFQWRHLDYNEDIEEKDKIIEDLKKYCGMDSYAMTVVYQWLKEIDENYKEKIHK